MQGTLRPLMSSLGLAGGAMYTGRISGPLAGGESCELGDYWLSIGQIESGLRDDLVIVCIDGRSDLRGQ